MTRKIDGPVFSSCKIESKQQLNFTQAPRQIVVYQYVDQKYEILALHLQAKTNTSGSAEPSVSQKPADAAGSTAAPNPKPTVPNGKPDGLKEVRNNIVPHAGFSRDKLSKAGALSQSIAPLRLRERSTSRKITPE